MLRTRKPYTAWKSGEVDAAERHHPGGPLKEPRYNTHGRWPRHSREYEDFEPVSQEDRIAALPSLMASNDPLDRIKALVIIEELSVTLPYVWCVVEKNDSPFRLAFPGAARSVWSAHETEDEALQWCAVTQANFDRNFERNRSPERGRRTFEIAFLPDAPATQLRMPAADPLRHNHAFTN